uniref:Uncharacterized protein LOC104219120 n=1 Tax=Nicotiana sylvestris TaxID=4096 RepID=A0A1U7VJ06_NICSY|nr:PREDICTED: uncharacterized protein LOC104219120 [Nicotiana sylvestris]
MSPANSKPYASSLSFHFLADYSSSSTMAEACLADFAYSNSFGLKFGSFVTGEYIRGQRRPSSLPHKLSVTPKLKLSFLTVAEEFYFETQRRRNLAKIAHPHPLQLLHRLGSKNTEGADMAFNPFILLHLCFNCYCCSYFVFQLCLAWTCYAVTNCHLAIYEVVASS